MTYDVTKILILTKFFSKMLLRQKNNNLRKDEDLINSIQKVPE